MKENTKNTLLKIGMKLLLLIAVLAVLDVLYFFTFYPKDLEEHCSLMDNETADMIADAGAYVVPTFCPYEEAIHYDPVALQDKQPEFRAKLELYKDSLQAGREVIKKAKHVKMGFGTDFVANHMNYDSGYEYKAWFESDMGVFRTLKAATSVNAEILQMEDKIGTL